MVKWSGPAHFGIGMFSYSKFYFWIFWDYGNKRFVNWAELGSKEENLPKNIVCVGNYNNHILEFMVFLGFPPKGYRVNV